MSAPLQPTDTSDLRPTLARHWAARVRKSTSDPWTPIRGIQSLDPQYSKSRQDAGDYHSGNATAQIATEGSWTLAITVGRKLDEAGAPDPGVELLRSLDSELGYEELVHVQWWRTDGLPDSYEGLAGVDFTSAGGEKASLQGATITLTGFGSRKKVAKPTATAVNEVQRIEIEGAPTSFKLKVLASVTSALTYSSLTASALQTALQALAPIGAGNVTVTGNNANGYVATFAGALAGIDVPVLVAVDIVGGTDPEVNISVVQHGQPAG